MCETDIIQNVIKFQIAFDIYVLRIWFLDNENDYKSQNQERVRECQKQGSLITIIRLIIDD